LVSGSGKNKLYRQTGDLRFEDITERAKIDGGDAWGSGATMVDVDLDIYVCNYMAPNELFVNQGGGRFIESAKAFCLDVTDACVESAFCDYDCDGDLDLYLVTYRIYHPTGAPAKLPVGDKGLGPFVLPEYRKYFGLRNTPGSKPKNGPDQPARPSVAQQR